MIEQVALTELALMLFVAWYFLYLGLFKDKHLALGLSLMLWLPLAVKVAE